MNIKTKNIITGALTFIVVLIFAGSGIFKLVGGEATAEMAKGLGGNSNLIILGILEIIIVALFLFPKTGVAGSLLMIAYMGGALAVSLVSGQPIIPLIFIQILIWITSVLRFPELGQRLFGKI
jgi:sorbitol-specific phosphotransferase system component IIC